MDSRTNEGRGCKQDCEEDEVKMGRSHKTTNRWKVDDKCTTVDS